MYQTGCNVTVMVQDMDKSVKFYVDTLGLSLDSRYGNEWATVKAPGIVLGLHPKKPGASPSKNDRNLLICLSVKDLDEAMGKLKSKGVAFDSGVIDDEFVKVVFFKDPDGAPLYLCEPKWKQG